MTLEQSATWRLAVGWALVLAFPLVVTIEVLSGGGQGPAGVVAAGGFFLGLGLLWGAHRRRRRLQEYDALARAQARAARSAR